MNPRQERLDLEARLADARALAALPDADLAILHARLAILQLGADEAEPAMRSCVAALRKDARSAPAWEAMAKVWWRLGHLDSLAEAVAAMRQFGAAREVADAMELRLMMAVGQQPRALELARGLAARPDLDAETLLLCGTAMLGARDASAAEAVAQRLLSLQPRAPKALSLLSSAHALRGDFALAAEAAQAALDASPVSLPEQWQALLTHLLASRQADRAATTASAALTAHPQAISLWRLAAAAFELAGQQPRALRCLAVAQTDLEQRAAAGDDLAALVREVMG